VNPCIVHVVHRFVFVVDEMMMMMMVVGAVVVADRDPNPVSMVETSRLH
jgi:hypothetical protein